VSNCPSCGSPLSGDETFCLQCGYRIVPAPPEEPGFGVPTFIVAAIALLAIGGIVFALDRVESDAEKSARKRVPIVTQPEPLKSDEKPTDVEAWPAGTSAYTVLLASEDDETAARSRATAAVGAGVPAGVLNSSDYPTLEPGRWVLFTGRFDTRELAAEEATRFAALGYPEAEAGFVSDQREPATSG
jgi:hypothetical protein